AGGVRCRESARGDRRGPPRRGAGGLYRAHGRRGKSAGARRGGPHAPHRPAGFRCRGGRPAAPQRAVRDGAALFGSGLVVRLFYQSLGASRRSTDGPYARKLAAILRSAAAPGTEIDVRGLAPGKAIADQYRYLEFRDTREILDNGLRAEHEGYDAFLI